MKSQERNTIMDDISWLKDNGISVKVIENGTKNDILNAISDDEAQVIVTSGHGLTNNAGLQTSDRKSLKPADLKNQKIGENLNTVIFENCFQGELEDSWENSFGNNIDVVGWEGETNIFETRSFNGTGLFDRQKLNLRDYLEKNFNPME